MSGAEDCERVAREGIGLETPDDLERFALQERLEIAEAMARAWEEEAGRRVAYLRQRLVEQAEEIAALKKALLRVEK